MFCSNCGKSIKEGSKFCPECGAGVGDSGTAASQATGSSGGSGYKQATSGGEKATGEKNYYEILEISRDAESDEIQQAIKKQRTLWSSRVPRGGSMGERARQIVELITAAEVTLLDSAKRAEYDQSLKYKKDRTVEIPVGQKNWYEVLGEYYDMQDWEMAREAAAKATQQQPENPDAWFLAASVFMNLGEYDQANHAAKQVLLLEPENPAAYGVRGDVLLLKSSSVNQAIEMYNKMMALATDASTKKLAAENICWARATAIEFKLEAIINSIPEEFEWSKEMMDRLQSKLGEAQRVASEMEAEFAKITDPSQWLQSLKKEGVGECRELVGEIERLIADGNKKVHLPGFWRDIILGCICLIVGIGIMTYDIGIGFGFIVIVCGAFAFCAFVLCTKPAYKANNAFMYKFLR